MFIWVHTWVDTRVHTLLVIQVNIRVNIRVNILVLLNIFNISKNLILSCLNLGLLFPFTLGSSQEEGFEASDDTDDTDDEDCDIFKSPKSTQAATRVRATALDNAHINKAKMCGMLNGIYVPTIV